MHKKRFLNKAMSLSYLIFQDHFRRFRDRADQHQLKMYQTVELVKQQGRPSQRIERNVEIDWPKSARINSNAIPLGLIKYAYKVRK